MFMGDTLWSGILGGLLAGAVALIFGGIPLVFGLFRYLRAQGDALELLDARITSEVKQRASKLGVEARRSKAALDAEVDELLSQQKPTTAPGRPRLLGTGRE